jgi:hypothetical protein
VTKKAEGGRGRAAVDPTFLQDDCQGQDDSELRKLQSVFLAPRKVARTGGVEALLRSNNVQNTIYQSGNEEPRGASMVGRRSQDGGLDYVPNRIPDGLSEQVAYPASLRSCWPMRLVPVVKMLGIHTQKCRLDGNLTNSTHNPQLRAVSSVGGYREF